MSTKKSGGTVKNGRDSNPKYLGVKMFEGEMAKTGHILVRQRGTRVLAGPGTLLGKDHTIFASRDGRVKFALRRKTDFDGAERRIKIVSVI